MGRSKRKNKRCIVTLRKEDRKQLERMLAGGTESVRVVKRAMVLLKMGDGLSSNQAAAAVGCTPETARKTGWRYINSGLDDALYERPRPGAEPLLDARLQAQLIAIACTKPPDGNARWSTALLAAEMMRRKLVPTISRETVRIVLKNHALKPWREKNVVHSRQSGQ